MISQNITKLIGEAMKAHDGVRLSTLRMLSSEFNYEKIKLQRDLTEEDEQNVLRKEARKRKDAIEAYKLLNAKNPNAKLKQEQEEKELNILQEFLPAELTEEELNQLISDSVNQIGAKTMADMGRVIADVKSKAPSADGSVIAKIVRQKLDSSV